MNLLPKTSSEFASEKYWNEFFQKRGKAAFEWYGEYWQLCGTLYKYLKKSDKLLVVGCGNSSLSADLYDSGYTSNVSIDISEVVIQQMIEKYGETRPHIQFHQMDASKMEYADEEFSVVVDKGTIDALTPNKDADTVLKLSGVFAEISRVLRVGGRFICISLLQRHVLETLLEWFSADTTWTWVVRIHRCIEAEKMDDPETTGLVLPVFIVVFTKLKRLPGLETVCKSRCHSAVCVLGNSSFLNLTINYRKKTWHLRCHSCYVTAGAIDIVYYEGHISDFSFLSCKLCYVTMSVSPRTLASLVSQACKHVQRARERSFGKLVIARTCRHEQRHVRAQIPCLQSSCQCQPCRNFARSETGYVTFVPDIGIRRLPNQYFAAVTHTFNKISHSSCLLPKGLSIRTRVVMQQAPGSAYIHRSRLKPKKKGRGGSKTFEVDVNHLCCEYYKYMVAGLTFVMPRATEHKATALLVGLGGGTLSMFLTAKFPKLALSVVELDPAVVDVARKWYLPSNCPIDITIDDGLCALKKFAKKGNNSVIAGKVFDVIFLDVDSKDLSKGLTCPPASFLEEAALKCLAAITAPTGKSSFSVVNFVCRNEALKSDVCERLKLHFSSVLVRKIPDNVNEVLYLKHEKQALDGEEVLGSLKTLNNLIRDSENSNDISDLFGELKIS
ncbi:unnamed protein product [Ixodes pacificus]